MASNVTLKYGDLTETIPLFEGRLHIPTIKDAFALRVARIAGALAPFDSEGFTYATFKPGDTLNISGTSAEAPALPDHNAVEPSQEMQSFWQALSAAECQEVGDARFLTLTSSGFPGEKGAAKDTLLVRTCYEHLAAIAEKHFAADGTIFILSGNPGIGKSLFSFYFMWLLAKQEQTMVWEKRHAADARIMFSPQGVFTGNANSFSVELRKSQTWYMVDGMTPTRQNAKTILVTSPDQQIFKEPFKWSNCAMRWMPVWSWNEILLAGKHVFGQKEQDIRERYEKWLGIPRFVLQQTSREHQESLDQAINTCSIAVLKSSFTNLNADSQISHKLIHATVTEGYFLGPAVVVKGYVENSLIAKYVESTDREVEDFLAASGGISDIASFRGKVLEKRKAHQILQRGGSFLCRDLQSDGDPFQLHLNPCAIRAPLWSHQEIQTLPNGVYGWGRNEKFAAVDAVCQPDLLYQVTVSEQHGINTRGLASAATKLRSGPGNAKLIFAVPPDVFTHDFSRQALKAIRGRPDLAELARSVKQYVIQIPIQPWTQVTYTGLASPAAQPMES